MPKKQVEVMMILNRSCKHSVRYDGTGEKPAITALYVMNEAVERLGRPKSVRVIVEEGD